jgi:hypothetical protein
MMLAAPAIISTTAQQQQPEWQSQYAVGLNKLDPHTYVWQMLRRWRKAHSSSHLII